MSAVKNTVCMACTAALLVASCAVSPEVEERRLATQANIAEILSEPLDVAEFGEPKRCLADHEFQTFRALDDRYILFAGRKERLWVNTLRAPCPDLRFGDVLIVRRFSGTRLCNLDTFEVTDWFSWPWYRRWPWHWGLDWGVGMRCTLGMFDPVTQQQVDEIEAVIRSR